MLIGNTFSDAGVGNEIRISAGDKVKYTVDLSGDFDGRLYLVKRVGTVKEFTQISADVVLQFLEAGKKPAYYSFVCKYAVGEVSLTGTAAWTLEDVAVDLLSVKNNDQKEVFKVDEDGVSIQGNFSQSVVQEPNFPGVSVVNESAGPINRTVITLEDFAMPVTSVTTGNAVGGVGIYTFPEGMIQMQMATAVLSVGVETQADFTDATPEGQIGLGTVAPANADALGTDATDDNIGTAEDFTMSSYVDASVVVEPEPLINLDGRVSAIECFLNALVDAADINNDVTTNLIFNGTVTLVWTKL